MKSTITMLLLAGLTVLASAGYAQTPQTNAAPPSAPPVAAPEPAKAPADADKPAADAPKPPVTAAEVVPLIVIDDVPLLDAVKNLARQSGLNFQFDPRVTVMSNQPNVTVRFEQVTAEDALTAVLDNYGLELKTDVKKHISKITIKDPRAEEPLVSRVIQLKYSAPSNIVTLLKSTLTPRSQVLPDQRTSQIVVLTTEKELAGVDALIEKLDTPTKQVLIEAQLWETAKAPSSVKGVDWSGTLESQSVSFGNGNTYGQVNNSTKYSDTTTKPGASVTDPGGRTITQPSSYTSTLNNTKENILNTVTGGGGFGLNTSGGIHPATAFLNADGLKATISFLNKDSDTELVATPRAVTLDNQLANLNVSRAYPVYKITPGSANSPAGSEVTWTNVGVILQVTPRIAANDNISMRVCPEVSDIAAQDKQIINGQTYTANIYGIRKVETHVMIRSGNTLVMGGLINDRSYKAYTKVPILGDAPGIGLLFRKDEKKQDKSNLLIFITPTIIADTDFIQSKPSGFLKSEFKPDSASKEPSWWDTGKPYDWTKPGTNAAPPRTAGSKQGKF